MKRLVIFGVFLATVLVSTTACGKREDPILRLSADEALELGKQFMADEKYFKASQHLTHAFEVEPNSRKGREALLLAADALYKDGGLDNFIRCEAKYRDFLNRFPTSAQADYAQFQIASCLAERVEKPDRDQKVTRKALEAYEELLRIYPTSPYVAEARQRILEVTDLLAEHELVIAIFYIRYGTRGFCQASLNRLEHLRDNFPTFSKKDAMLFHLGLAYERCRRPDEAEAAFLELRRDYPDSEFLDGLERARKKNLKKAS